MDASKNADRFTTITTKFPQKNHLHSYTHKNNL